MKKLFLSVVIALVGITGIANAQTDNQPVQQLKPAQNGTATNNRTMGTPEDRAKKQTTMLTTQLNLDAAAQTKVYDINLKYAQKQEDLRKSGKPKEEMMPAMQQMMKDKDADLKGVLTADQYKTYTEKRGQMRPTMGTPQEKK